MKLFCSTIIMLAWVSLLCAQGQPVELKPYTGQLTQTQSDSLAKLEADNLRAFTFADQHGMIQRRAPVTSRRRNHCRQANRLAAAYRSGTRA